MKKMIAVLFYILFFAVYPCKPLITDYLEKTGIAADSKNLELYTDSVQNFDSNLIFKLNDKLYIYGEEFMSVNDKTYRYLGNGYYKNDGTVYFFRQKTAEIKDSDKVRTSVKTEEVDKFKGTSCDGQFHEYFYFLEINNTKYENGEKKSNFVASLFNKILGIFRRQ